MRDQLVAEEYALNKKDAKKRAAEVGIERVVPEHMRDKNEEKYTSLPTPEVYIPPPTSTSSVAGGKLNNEKLK